MLSNRSGRCALEARGKWHHAAAVRGVGTVVFVGRTAQDPLAATEWNLARRSGLHKNPDY